MLVERLDAENVDAWGQVVGWLKIRRRGLKSWRWWGIDGSMLVGKLCGDLWAWDEVVCCWRKPLAKMADHMALVCACVV